MRLTGTGAVLFDLDGTVVDTIPHILASFRHATGAVLGAPLPDDELMHHVGVPLATQMRYFTEDEETAERLLAAYREFNHRTHDEMARLYPNTRATLEALAAAGLPMAIVTSKSRMMAERAAEWIIEAMGVPFSTPGTVIAILLIFVSTWAAAAMGRFGLSFDSPAFWMGFAYALKYSAVSARMLSAAYRQVHPSLEEAAVVSGATTFILLRTIWFPLLSRTVIAAWFLTALPMFTELTMSVLLTGPGGATMGTVLFQLQEYADQPSAAALAGILLSAALLGAFFMRGRKAEEILEGR